MKAILHLNSFIMPWGFLGKVLSTHTQNLSTLKRCYISSAKTLLNSTYFLQDLLWIRKDFIAEQVYNLDLDKYWTVSLLGADVNRSK